MVVDPESKELASEGVFGVAVNFSSCDCSRKRFVISLAAAIGGVTNGGLRGVWPPFLKIGRNRPFSPFFCLFRPFPEGAKSTWGKSRKRRKKAFLLRYPQICLNPHLLNPPICGTPNFKIAAIRVTKMMSNFVHQLDQTLGSLDGLVIRNANRGDSRESIRS